MINILNRDGTLNGNAGTYRGLTIQQARQRVVDDLQAAELLLEDIVRGEVQTRCGDGTDRCDGESAIEAAHTLVPQCLPQRVERVLVHGAVRRRPLRLDLQSRLASIQRVAAQPRKSTRSGARKRCGPQGIRGHAIFSRRREAERVQLPFGST